MSDSNEKNVKKQVIGLIETVENTAFFKFSKPYLDYIGKGSLFKIVYIIMALVSLLGVPIGAMIFGKNIFQSHNGQLITWFILTWLGIVFAGWVGFQLWWNRKNQVTELAEKKAEFVVTPICSLIIQTFGEWAATLIAIIGFTTGLFGLFCGLGDEVGYLIVPLLSALLGPFSMFLMEGNIGISIIFIGPLIGFIIWIITRLFAELFRIIVALANNTKDIADNIKNK
jgi:hypothetical protein